MAESSYCIVIIAIQVGQAWDLQSDDAAVKQMGGSLYTQNSRLRGCPPPAIVHR